MGGPGSGRKSCDGSVPYVPVLTVAERKARRLQIAECAAKSGVFAAMAAFNVSACTVYYSLRSNRMHPAHIARGRAGAGAMQVLKRMLLDNETPEVAAITASVSVSYAKRVQRLAIAAGFTFQEHEDDRSLTSNGTDAEKPDSGERGEGPAVG